MDSKPCLVLTTCPDENSARQLALRLLENRLAACIQIIPGVKSLYIWKGVVEEACEHQLFIKTSHDKLLALQTSLHQHHPYEVPECLVLDMQIPSQRYAQWLQASLHAE